QGWFYRDFQSWEISAELEAFKYANSSINFSTKGTMDLRGFNGIDSTSADFALADVDINSFLLESLDGSVNFTDGLVKNNSMVDFRAQNYSGSITELSAESITNLSIACKVFADEWIVSRLIKELPGVRITGEGEFDYTRNEGNHDFQGIFTADSLNYGTLSSGKTTCDVQYGKKTGEAAEANINGLMTDLTLGEKKFDQSLFIITAGQGKIYCEKLEGHNVAGEFISITGEISDSLRSFDVSSFKGMLNTLPFEFDPFRMYEKDKKYLLDQTAVYIGDGRIKLSGEFGGRTDYRLQSSLENINLRLMNDFFNFSQRFQGTANGDLQLSNFTNSPILFSDLVITDGFFDEIKFQHINGKFTYRNQRLMFSDVFMDAETGKASLAGLVTLGKDGSGDFKLTERDSLAIDIKLEKFSLSAINRYVPWSLHTDGQVIGDINISGSPASPKIVGDFVITDPVIDKITGETLTGRIVYENKRAYFKGAQLITDSGSYTGSGFIPVNLNILTENRRDFLDDPMDLMLTGTSGQFEFLTPYIELLDSLSGDFSLQLSISGTYKNPIRNGQLIVKNGMMSVLPVTNTLYGINGFATIDNNQFMIKNMSGITRVEERDDDLWGSIKKFYRSLVGSGKTDLKESRFTVSGGMDLTQFFKPEFDISFKGDDLFFASSENIFKGIASLEFMITGRDTILVSGEIVPSPYEFFITDEFDFDYNPEVSRKANVALIAYDIHVPLDNVVIVKNSFIPEMELDGDLNITSVGYGNTRFSGTVNVLSGSFILSGTEFTDAEGTLFLDPSNTVPSVDIEALTSISATEYRLFFTGDLNNPTIEIRDEDTGTFITPDQQNGILRLLIAREEGAGPGLDETGKSIFSNYLETEFEGFVSRYSPIDRFQVQSSKALLTDFNKADVNIYIGKNLTRKLYMDIRSDVFSDQVTNEYEVGYRINRNMSIVGRLDEYGLPHMNYRIKIKY
nr:translocation/assembly module TamB domain-containing protein [FCB group bacterium]